MVNPRHHATDNSVNCMLLLWKALTNWLQKGKMVPPLVRCFNGKIELALVVASAAKWKWEYLYESWLRIAHNTVEWERGMLRQQQRTTPTAWMSDQRRRITVVVVWPHRRMLHATDSHVENCARRDLDGCGDRTIIPNAATRKMFEERNEHAHVRYTSIYNTRIWYIQRRFRGVCGGACDYLLCVMCVCASHSHGRWTHQTTAVRLDFRAGLGRIKSEWFIDGKFRPRINPADQLTWWRNFFLSDYDHLKVIRDHTIHGGIIFRLLTLLIHLFAAHKFHCLRST